MRHIAPRPSYEQLCNLSTESGQDPRPAMALHLVLSGCSTQSLGGIGPAVEGPPWDVSPGPFCPARQTPTAFGTSGGLVN